MSDDDVDDCISEHGLRKASRLMGTDGVNATKAPTDEENREALNRWLARPRVRTAAKMLRIALGLPPEPEDAAL